MSDRIKLPSDEQLELSDFIERGFEWEGIRFNHEKHSRFVTDKNYCFKIEVQICPLDNDAIKCWTTIHHGGLIYQNHTRFPEYNVDASIRAALSVAWSNMLSEIGVIKNVGRMIYDGVFKSNPLREST